MIYNLKELEKKYSGSELEIILYIKENWGIGNIRKNFSKLINNKRYRRFIINYKACESAEELNKHINAENAPLSKQLIWAANIILFYRKDINLFISLKEKFENKLLFADYNKAIDILEEIKMNFGVSYWYYNCKLLVYEYMNSEKTDDSIYKEILQEFGENLLGKVMIEEFHIRLQAGYHYNTYHNRFSQIRKSIEEEGFRRKEVVEVFNYISYKVDPFYNLNESELASVLSIESSASLIDYYLTFKDVISKLSGNLKDDTTDKVICSILKIFDGKLNDETINNIEIITGVKKIRDVTDKNDKVLLEILDYYTSGRYEICLKLCKNSIESKFISNEILEIYPKCIIKKNNNIKIDVLENTILETYFLNRILLENKEGNIQHSLKILSKLAADLNTTKFGSYLKSLLLDEYQLKELEDSEFNSSIVNFSTCNPKLYTQIVKQQKKIDSIEELLEVYYNSSTISLYKYIVKNDTKGLETLNLPKERYLKYYAKILIEQGNYIDAISILRKLELSCKNGDLNYIISSLILCYINLNRIEECIKLIVKYSLENMNLLFNIPLLDIINRTNDQYKSSLDLVIFYTLCSINIENIEEFVEDINEKIFDEYENYLDSINLKKPSELFKGEINQLKFFFLENVCTVNVMSNSKEFYESSEVDDERMKILNFLIKCNNEPNKLIDKYINELSSLSENKLFRKAVKEVGKNKIIINIEQFKIEVHKTLKEKFNMYIGKMDESFTDVKYVIQEISAENEEIGHMPEDNNIKLFYTIVFEARDIFVILLDCCLGADIRHGRLVNQLRVPFERKHLIMTKDRDTNEYLINSYWINRYGSLNEKELKLINDNLIPFTKTMNSLFEEVKRKWIQIRKEGGNGVALFDFAFEIDSLETLRKKFTKNSRFEEFFDNVLQLLLDKTNHNLENVKNKITNDLYNTISEECVRMLKKLNNDLVTENEKLCNELINNLKYTNTNSQYNLQTVADWFNFSNELEGKPFAIEHSVNVALGILNELHPNNTIKCDVKIDEDIILSRRTLKYYVNIFFTILENSIKHKKKNDISVELYIYKENEEEILIKFINNVGEVPSISDKERIKEINEKLKKDVTNDDIIREGGTGFLKVRKIINIDLMYRYSNIVLKYDALKFSAELSLKR